VPYIKKTWKSWGGDRESPNACEKELHLLERFSPSQVFAKCNGIGKIGGNASIPGDWDCNRYEDLGGPPIKRNWNFFVNLGGYQREKGKYHWGEK